MMYVSKIRLYTIGGKWFNFVAKILFFFTYARKWVFFAK